MKKLYLTLIFCICAGLNTAAAIEKSVAENPCKQMRYSTRLNLTTSYGQLKYNQNYNNIELTKLGYRYGLVQSGMYISGLSLIGVDWSVSLNTVARGAKDNSVCVLPTSIDVFIGYREPTVYLDKNLLPQSCRYQQVLRHEHQHLQVSVAALEYFLPQIRRQIYEQIALVEPRHIDSLSEIDAATAEMNEEYVILIRPMVDSFKATLLHEQKKLDNKENYQYESKICPK